MSFFANNRGNIAINFALAAVPLIVMIGFAVDLSMTQTYRDAMQQQLDSAVLAGVREDSADEAAAKALEFFQAKYPDITPPSFTYGETDSDVTLKGELTYARENIFGAFLGKSATTIGISSTAAAPMKIKEIRFRPISAAGWWDKTVSLMVTPEGGGDDVEMAKITYTSKKNSGYSFSASPSGWVDLGDYEYAYLFFYIDPDSFEFDKFCSGCATEIRSDDPDYSDRLFVDGEQMEKGVVVDIFSAIPCDVSTQEWEDGGGGQPDIKFYVDGVCETSSSGYVRLIE